MSFHGDVAELVEDGLDAVVEDECLVLVPDEPRTEDEVDAED